MFNTLLSTMITFILSIIVFYLISVHIFEFIAIYELGLQEREKLKKEELIKEIKEKIVT